MWFDPKRIIKFSNMNIYYIGGVKGDFNMNNLKAKPKAYDAYLLCFSANNIRERKKLLETIITDPHVCALFAKNCEPTNDEINFILPTILKSEKACFNLILDNVTLNKKQRKAVFKKTLNDKSLAFYLVEANSLKKHEIKNVYKCFKYSQFTYHEFIQFCILCKDLIGKKEKAELVRKIINKQDIASAKYIMENIKLNQHLIDLLNGFLVISNLT